MDGLEKKVVVLIQSDPLTSHRACEGLRIALGLVASGHELSVLLAGKGVCLLEEEKDDFVDEDRLEKFLAVLKTFVPVFFIDEASVAESAYSKLDHETVFLSKEALALKIAGADTFFRF